MTPREKIKISVPRNLKWVAWIGSAAKGMAGVWGLTEERQFHLELAIVEAVTNSITHSKESVEISFFETERGVRIEILDDGEPVADGLLARFQSLPEPDPERPETWPESGQGLFLIQETMQEVEFFRVGERNCLSFLCQV